MVSVLMKILHVGDKKTRNDNLPPAEDRIYDLLVDGELDNDHRQTLLRSLDGKPGGWRRCALAFLEAQSWGQEFRSLSARLSASSTKAASDTPVTSKSVPGKSVVGKKSSYAPKRLRKMGPTGVFLGLAASFLLAMGITSLVRDMNPGGMPGTIVPLGSDRASILSSSLRNTIKPPTMPRLESRVGPLGLKDGAAKSLHVFNLTGQAPDGKARSFGLPAITQNNLNEQWIKEMPTSIPDGVVQSFQQAGHDVKTTRKLIPFQMKDGRTLVIPVDQVDVRYATTPYYQ